MDAIGKSPSRFDFDKLQNMNGHYLRSAKDRRLVSVLRELLPEIDDGDWYASRWNTEIEEQLTGLMPGLQERAKTLLDLLDGGAFPVQ